MARFPGRGAITVARSCFALDMEPLRVTSASYMNPTRRNTQEDAHGSLDPFRTTSDSSDSLFLLFDGHGGRGTVDFVSHALSGNVKHFLDREDCGDDVSRALRAAFLFTDMQSRKVVEVCGHLLLTPLHTFDTVFAMVVTAGVWMRTDSLRMPREPRRCAASCVGIEELLGGVGPHRFTRRT